MIESCASKLKFCLFFAFAVLLVRQPSLRDDVVLPSVLDINLMVFDIFAFLNKYNLNPRRVPWKYFLY